MMMLPINFKAAGVAKLALAGLALLTLAACQTGTEEVLDPDEVITEADLRAYCPQVILREGTSSFRTYTKGNDGNADAVIYQASIADQTRTCKYRNGQLLMTVAVAGRVVTGPEGRTGTIELPIRVAIVEGAETVYSQLGRLSVSVTPTGGASQFLYTDDQIVLPEPSERNLVIYIGFDEGPYDTP
jgi:ABC-type Fe3+-hydroxamate transport system substrate-binding protein